MPKVSVIIPVYNVEKYLKDCLDSVLAQTFQDIEIICVNDGSTDKSLEILQQYAKKDERIKVLNQENKGTSVARNFGLEKSQVQYIAFVDGDDVLSSEYIKILLNNLIKTDAEVSCCNFQKKGFDKFGTDTRYGITVSEKPLSNLLYGNNPIYFTVWNKLYKKDIIGNLRFDDRNQYEDWVFTSLLFTNLNKICWTNRALYYYRIREDSIMREAFNLNKLNSCVEGIRRVYNFYQINCPEFLNEIKKIRLSRTLKMLIKKTLKSNNAPLIAKSKEEVKKLYSQEIAGYAGLSIKYKIKLWKFLH